jgi:hypothetical protein
MVVVSKLKEEVCSCRSPDLPRHSHALPSGGVLTHANRAGLFTRNRRRIARRRRSPDCRSMRVHSTPAAGAQGRRRSARSWRSVVRSPPLGGTGWRACLAVPADARSDPAGSLWSPRPRTAAGARRSPSVLRLAARFRRMSSRRPRRAVRIPRMILSGRRRSGALR